MVALIALIALAGHPRMLQMQELPQRDAQDLTLSQATSKAQTLLQRVVGALGGEAFLNLRDSDCNGNLSEFGHGGDPVLYVSFREMWLLPDSNRFEYTSATQKLITIFSQGGGWFLSKLGVFEEPQEEIAAFAARTKTRMENVLRLSAEGKGPVFRFTGKSAVDHEEAEWIEVSNFDGNEMRLGVDAATALPTVWEVISKNADTGDSTDNVTQYARYTANDGVQIPLITSHQQNGRLISQTVFSACKYNTGISPTVFTRDSLSQARDEGGGKRSRAVPGR